MSEALRGIRVIDLTRGPAGGMATMILADFGAEVLSITGPGEDALAQLPAAPLWRRGKQQLELDLDDAADMVRLHQLCDAADVLVCNWRPSALKRKQLDFDSIHARHPQLVYCHISAFGREGPMAECPGYEHIVAAYSGRMHMFAGIVDREGPVFSALQVGVHACSQSAATGILAALLERGENGVGRLVETSMLQGMLPYEQGPMLGTQWAEKFPDLLPAIGAPPPEPPMPSLFYHPAQAGDGRWMQFGNLLPHLFDNFLINTDLIDIIADPDFNPRQLMLSTPEKHEAFRERMLKRIQERPAADWMEQLIADGGVVAATYQTTQQALQDPDVIDNGHVITTKDGVQLGPLARMGKTPATPGASARTDTEIIAHWLETPRPAPTRKEEGLLPLSGIRVIEIATIIAAPLGSSFLAEMGADVIKVEQIGGDPFRGMLSGIGSARVNAGKRSISVNMKADAGQQIVLDLIRDADVVIHNFRPGVPERLGFGYEQVIAVNPNIVYLQSNGYGPDGPSALRPSTHPIPGAAMGGVMYQMGERLPTELQGFDSLCTWTRRLMRANEVNPDPNTAMVVATTATLGLVARQRTGQGQQIMIDMFGANAYANHDDFLNYPGKPSRALPDEGMHGLSATYRLYPCAENQWVFLALNSERERNNFVTTLREAGFKPPNVSALATAGDQVATALAALFASQDATYWQNLLVKAGVGCVRADGYAPNEFWLKDPQSQAMDLTTPAEHPTWGAYRRHGPMIMFDGKRQPLYGPPLAGQHNSELLASLGYPPEKIASWSAEGVLWQEA